MYSAQKVTPRSPGFKSLCFGQGWWQESGPNEHVSKTQGEHTDPHTHTQKKLLQILFSQEKRRQRFKYTATAKSKLIVNDGNKIKIKLWDTVFSLLNIDHPALFCICGRHMENDFNIISIVQ